MEYREYPSPAPLSAIIQCIWTLEGDASETQLTSRLLLRPIGRISVVGLRLHPDGAAALIREPQDRLAGLTVAVDVVCPRLATILHPLCDRSSGPEDLVRRVATDLSKADTAPLDRRIRSAIERIEQRRGIVGVGDLAVEAGLTVRHLERRFLAVVGVTPKRLARIARFQHALSLLERVDVARGTRTATDCGYADQAHFVRDFRKLAGCAPGAHLMQKAEMTGFFTVHRVRD